MRENLRQAAKDAARIYSRLEDNTSREIFENRVMMCLLKKSNEELMDEKSVLRSARDRDIRVMNLMEKIAQLKGGVIIYGAGEIGQYIHNHPKLRGG